MNYRGYIIEYSPPPIPIRSWDWVYWHEGYDGPGDSRVGHAASEEACRAEIDERILESTHEQANRASTSDTSSRVVSEQSVPLGGACETG